RGAAGGAFDDRVKIDRGLGEVGAGSDQAGLDLTGTAPLPDHEVAEHAAVVMRVVGRESLGLRPFEHLVAGTVGRLGGEVAVLDVQHLIPAAPGSEPEDKLTVLLTERVLDLVAVPPLFEGRHDRIEVDFAQMPDSGE